MSLDSGCWKTERCIVGPQKEHLPRTKSARILTTPCIIASVANSINQNKITVGSLFERKFAGVNTVATLNMLVLGCFKFSGPHRPISFTPTNNTLVRFGRRDPSLATLYVSSASATFLGRHWLQIAMDRIGTEDAEFGKISLWVLCCVSWKGRWKNWNERVSSTTSA